MMKLLGRSLGVFAVTTLVVGLGATPGQAHHSDWGLPLVGGLVGGAGLTALYYNSQKHDQERSSAPAAQVVQPVYVTPAAVPAPVVTTAPTLSATSIEDKLNVLDQLAAKGYITPAQYQARRQALLDQL